MKAVERQHGVCKFSVVWWLGSRVSKAHCAEKFDYMSPEALLSPFTAEGDCNRLLHLSLQSVQSETDEHALPPSRVCTQEENVSSKNYLVMEKWSFKKKEKEIWATFTHSISCSNMIIKSAFSYIILERITEQFLLKMYLTVTWLVMFFLSTVELFCPWNVYFASENLFLCLQLPLASRFGFFPLRS